MSLNQRNLQLNKHFSDYEDEISVEEILLIVFKRKWIIINITILSLFFGLLFRFILPPVFESHSIIKIGQINSIYLEDPLVLIEKVKQKYHKDDNKKLPFLESISLGSNSHNIIILKVKGRTTKEARDFLKEIVYFIIKEHKKYFDTGIIFQKQRLAALQSQIDQIKKDEYLFDERIKQITGRDNIGATILIFEKSEITKRLTDLENELGDVGFSLSYTNSNPSEVIQEPTLTKKPIGLSLIQYIIILILLGIILSVFYSLLMEFYGKFRTKLTLQQEK